MTPVHARWLLGLGLWVATAPGVAAPLPQGPLEPTLAASPDGGVPTQPVSVTSEPPAQFKLSCDGVVVATGQTPMQLKVPQGQLKLELSAKGRNSLTLEHQLDGPWATAAYLDSEHYMYLHSSYMPQYEALWQDGNKIGISQTWKNRFFSVGNTCVSVSSAVRSIMKPIRAQTRNGPLPACLPMRWRRTTSRRASAVSPSAAWFAAQTARSSFVKLGGTHVLVWSSARVEPRTVSESLES